MFNLYNLAVPPAEAISGETSQSIALLDQSILLPQEWRFAPKYLQISTSLVFMVSPVAWLATCHGSSREAHRDTTRVSIFPRKVEKGCCEASDFRSGRAMW